MAGDGDFDSVGGLVGRSNGSITASYATGEADGGDDNTDYVGGLVGFQADGSITASYATGDADGGAGSSDGVGGLVGGSFGSITASYATGDADGGDGDSDNVGGLVGLQDGGSITASYATGDADGGDGQDFVGGLAGFRFDASPITASYGFGEKLNLGDSGSSGSDGSSKPRDVSTAADLTAANAEASWNSTDTLTSGAWDFGTDVQIPALNYADYDGAGTVFDCSQFPAGVCGTLILGQRQLSVRLTLEGAATVAEGTIVTLSARLNSVVASETVVRLVVVAGGAGTADDADIVIEGDEFSVTIAAGVALGITTFTVLDDDIDEGSEILVIGIAAGDDLFSDQIIEVMITDNDTRGVEISATSLNLTEGERGTYTVVLTSQPNTGRVTVILASSDPARVRIGDITAGSMPSDLVFSAENWHIPRIVQIITFPAPDGMDAVKTTHRVEADVGGDYADVNAADVVVTVEESGDGNQADRDHNGLIEIDSLLMLHNMRYNLAGTSYKTTSTASVKGDSSGCPFPSCIGYELTRNLDFDRNSDGSTWSGNAESSFTLDLGDNHDEYFPVAGTTGDYTGGWLPIGDETGVFAAVFDGNGHKISNLAIRRDQTYIGLFGAIGNGAAIRNLGLVNNLADYTGTSNNNNFIGGLVGASSGSITASYATDVGAVAGGDGNNDYVGGLVGFQSGSAGSGMITASYATGDADGRDGDDTVGGLVGFQSGSSTITASYATGAVAGGEGTDTVGGLVGLQSGSSTITASYATGGVDGGNGDFDNVGGLVGKQNGGSITASLWLWQNDGRWRGVRRGLGC